MTVPGSLLSVAFVVAMVVPGVVFGGVRTWLRGYRWSDQSAGARVLGAVLVSVVLDAVYLVVLGTWLTPWITAPRDTLSARPALAGVAILVMAVVIPTALALGLHAELRFEAPSAPWWPRWLKLPRRQTAYESTPTAWDKAAPRQGDKWIRISLPDGQRVGGWMSGASYVSTYPQPRDVFVQEQFRVNADGSFGERVPGTAGVWLAVTDGCVVEWLEGPEEVIDE